METCSHGIRLFGANPPPCVQCELAWCEMVLPVRKKAYEDAQREYEDVLRRAGGVTKPCSSHKPIRKSEGDTRYWVECEKCGEFLREIPIPNNA